MKRICVFTGSSPGADPAYLHEAEELAREIVSRGYDLVYGGANVGLMGAVADAALEAGGRVMGVIPEALVSHEVANRGVSDLRIVPSMHKRKEVMADLSDGFIALPGGLGTMEELLEILTWAQLGFHGRPCGQLNTRRYFDLLLGFLDHAVAQRFVRLEHRQMLFAASRGSELLDAFAAYKPVPSTGKWIDRESHAEAELELAPDGAVAPLLK